VKLTTSLFNLTCDLLYKPHFLPPIISCTTQVHQRHSIENRSSDSLPLATLNLHLNSPKLTSPQSSSRCPVRTINKVAATASRAKVQPGYNQDQTANSSKELSEPRAYRGSQDQYGHNRDTASTRVYTATSTALKPR